MTNEEFEKKWTENRKEILANNEEYQRIVQSYKSSGWIDYIIFIAGFVICENYTKTIINTRVRDKKRLEKVGNLVKNSYLYR